MNIKYTLVNVIVTYMIGLIAGSLPLAAQATQPDFPTSIDTRPQTVVEYRVVGVTVTEADGAPSFLDDQMDAVSGAAAMNQLCQREVHPRARFATFSDYRNTPGARSLVRPSVGGGAWVDPGIVTVLFTPDASDDALDWIASPQQAPQLRLVLADALGAGTQFSCAGWRTTSKVTFGAYIAGGSGLAAFDSCDRSHQVLCAAPVAVPAVQ
jgi:hypothetical protein